MKNELMKLMEIKKKNKKLTKNEQTKAQNLLKEELLQNWGKGSKKEGDKNIFQVLSPAQTADTISSLWPELNQNLIMRWYTDFKEGENGVKCGVKVALKQILNEQTSGNSWQLLKYLTEETFKETNKKAQKVFLSALFNKDEFYLKNKFPTQTESFQSICEPLWKAMDKKKSLQTKLHVASWIRKIIGENSKEKYSNLINAIKRTKEIAFCKSIVLQVYDDLNHVTISTINTKEEFDPLKTVEDLRKWVVSKKIKIEKLFDENRNMEFENKDLKSKMERLREISDKRGEEIENLKEQISKSISAQKNIEQKLSQLIGDNESLRKEIASLKTKHKESIEHLSGRLEKTPQIRVDEYKSRLSSKLRMFMNDIKGIQNEKITTNMEKVLYGQFLQMFEVLEEEGVKTS